MRRSKFAEQLRQRQEAAKTSDTPREAGGTSLEEMSAGELRYVALERPTDEMSLQELRWVTSGAAERMLEEQAPRPKLSSVINDLRKTRRKGWK